MNPIEILKNEHRVIEQVLDCLSALASRYRETGHVDVRDARDMVDFFRQFADEIHHRKEEDLLFPAMESKGLPRDGGPTGVMLHEHEQGRIHIRGMCQALDALPSGDSAAIEEFAQHADAFVDLLRQHIQKEDHCLFPMADQALSDIEQQQLAGSFDTADSAPTTSELRNRYTRLAGDLVRRYSPTTSDTNPPISS